MSNDQEQHHPHQLAEDLVVRLDVQHRVAHQRVGEALHVKGHADRVGGEEHLRESQQQQREQQQHHHHDQHQHQHQHEHQHEHQRTMPIAPPSSGPREREMR